VDWGIGKWMGKWWNWRTGVRGVGGWLNQFTCEFIILQYIAFINKANENISS